jgi:hypothetical protein
MEVNRDEIARQGDRKVSEELCKLMTSWELFGPTKAASIGVQRVV